MSSKIYILPALLAENTPKNYFPEYITDIILSTDFFIVENEKAARRMIKFFAPDKQQSHLQLFPYDKNAPQNSLNEIKQYIVAGQDFGLLSDAGMPCIADPGNAVIAWAHRNQVKVIPTIGPSSILMALVASGFNGQQFTFHGYLPIDKTERKRKINYMEQQNTQSFYTQIFMETPYRNLSLLEDLCNYLSPSTLLCIASNISDTESEMIQTKSVAQWKIDRPKLHKIPAIFLIGG